jgi:LmbE family N-acetylglucosaminyl deacetylase
VLRAIREDEARAALHRLGVRSQPHFLRAPDGGLTQLGDRERGALAAALAQRIVTLRAHIVFAPWPRDPHPDHVATADIVQTALGLCGRRPAVYFYGVWLPVRGGADEHPQQHEAEVYDVPLTARDLDRKRAAIMEHRSQTGALIDHDPEGFHIGCGSARRMVDARRALLSSRGVSKRGRSTA